MLQFLSYSAVFSQQLIWGKQFGSGKEDYVMNHINDGCNTYIPGKTSGQIGDSIYGKNDGFIVKIDSAGTLLWSEQFGTTEDENILGSAYDPQGFIYITGSTMGSFVGKNAGREDVFVAKFNTNGQLIWKKQFGSDSSDIANSAHFKSGFLFISGNTNGKMGDIVFGKTDGFIMKLDQYGNPVFTTQFGTEENDMCNSIACSLNSKIYVCGSTWGKLGGTNKGFLDIFTGVFNENGENISYFQYGTEGFDFAMNINVSKNEELYICGSTSANFSGTQLGEGDCIFFKTSSGGDTLWSRQFSTPKHDGVRSIIFDDNSGNVLISGLINLPTSLGFIRSYTTGGEFIQKKTVDKASGKDISIDNSQNLYYV